MPGAYLRGLTGRHRTRAANRRLGALLAFNAGAINAGGFLAVQRYTSHMTGVVSALADDLVLGAWVAAGAGLLALLAFVAGAMTTAVLTNWARRRAMHSEYALALLLEALLLLVFGLLGGTLEHWSASLGAQALLPATVLLLCFIMGLQNAVVTKISNAEIRTTHLTGVITDIGIELGRAVYWNAPAGPGEPTLPPVQANRERLAVLVLIAGLFFAGGLVGALAFKHSGFIATVPLALALVLLAALPVLDDLRGRAHPTP
ncbi:YoaK family protein [Leptothrix discophora]|uniref:YoaK family protein n=1 Tax=Leptothrix discophora TaxID=89 RepID=A0ABT9FXW8_LEPDI|nr:YoaK family protein [Leptothrix discophora]MDP4299084.1 YoaK family protein [Leptothrix discophora]